MQNSIIFFLISQILSFPLIPIWNLENSSINLLPSGTETKDITIYNKSNGISAKLYKQLKRTSSNSIQEQNYISVNNEGNIKTDWEDIESIYYLVADEVPKGYYVCPKGANFLNKYENGNFTPMKPYSDDSSLAWELLCYRQPDKNYIFQGFLNNEKNTNLYGLYYKDDSSSWINDEGIKNGIYDFLWTTDSNTNNENEYSMYAIVLIESQIYLENIIITINNYENNKNFYINTQSDNYKTYLDEKSSFTRAYFDHDSTLLYWISANKTDDFSSGYSKEKIDIKEKRNNILVHKNSDSPFKFFGSYKINQLDMIRNTKFAYYEIENNDNKNEYYSGIIDISSNKIIFNTNTKFTKFIPLNSYSMIGLTETNAYQICTIKYNNECVESCPPGYYLIFDSINGNHCESTKKCDLTLIPEEICIESCNTTFFTLNDDRTQCGLCKDIYPDNKPYKIYGEEGCKSEDEIKHTYPLYEEYNIVGYCDDSCKECKSLNECTECYSGFELSEGKCVKEEESNCDDNCKRCVKDSPKNCTSCYDNYLLQADKAICINNCEKGYYKQSEYCLNCHKNCETCSKGAEMDNNEENQNCETCKSNWNYIIKGEGLPSNCVNECPEKYNTTYCISTKTDNKNPKEKSQYMLWIFIILIFIILLIISIYICKKHCYRDKNDGEIINDINTELRENNNIVD